MSSSRIGLLGFQAGGHRRRPNLALGFWGFILCCNIFCYGCMFAFVFFDLVAGKKVSEIIFFCAGWDIKH